MRAGGRMILIDSLGDSHPSTKSGAVMLPSSGQYGNFRDAIQSSLINDLNRLTQGRRDIPLVFFCQGPYCWESYNAALRARAGGFPNVYWYRGGLTAWQAAGLPMQAVQ
jgi:PQQ-dependent catabolism-associated CXXCW motif protein